MMNKRLRNISILAMGLVLTASMLSGCNNVSNDINNNSSRKAEAKDKEEKDIDYFEIGSELLKKESIGGLRLGMKEGELKNILGEATVKGKSEVWGSDGLEHKTWNYDNADVGLVKGKDDFIVFSIHAKEGFKGETLKKIGIGSKRKEVLDAYMDQINPEGLEGEKDTIVAGSIYSGIIFKFEEGKVSEIFMGASAE